ncbi:MAG: GNAT family N-acetyltransferase [Deltaproteobacteria bacterium]|nr:GNAT family N-acetyltransferase [Deltaproteobacteria bacterium]
MGPDTSDETTSVRPGCVDDVPFVFEGIRALAEFEALSHEFHGSAERLRDHLFGSLRCAELLIAEAEGRRAGYALFFTTYSTFLTRPGLFLEDIYVVPHARRRGVARALLGELARLAVARECGRLEWSVLDWNQRAIALYESVAAAPVRGWTSYRLDGPALARLGQQRV